MKAAAQSMEGVSWQEANACAKMAKKTWCKRGRCDQRQPCSVSMKLDRTYPTLGPPTLYVAAREGGGEGEIIKFVDFWGHLPNLWEDHKKMTKKCCEHIQSRNGEPTDQECVGKKVFDAKNGLHTAHMRAGDAIRADGG